VSFIFHLAQSTLSRA